MGPWPVLKSCKHNGLIFRSVKMFQSQDWPLRPVSSQEPRATSSSPAWSLPQGCPGPTRSRGHPSGPPTPQPVFPREKMVPPSVPGQPLASGSAWDPSPGAKHQTRLLLQTKPRRTPSLCLDPRALLLPPLRPSAPRRAPPAIPSSPQAAPQLRPLARRGTDRFLSWVHGGRFPGPRPSRHRSPQRLPLPQQPPPPPPRLAGRAALGAALTGLGTCAPAA